MKVVIAGLYSNSFFDGHTQEILDSVPRVLGMTGSFLWRLYLIVILCAVALNMAIVRYRWLHGALKPKWAQTQLTMAVLPRVSEWHVLLSDMLLPASNATLALDVLTKNGTLYKGQFQDKMLGPDGSLQTITLAGPRRFQREEYNRAREQNASASREMFWRTIEGKLFVIVGSDIASVNVRYLLQEDKTAGLGRPKLSEEDLIALRGFLQKLGEPEQIQGADDARSS